MSIVFEALPLPPPVVAATPSLHVRRVINPFSEQSAPTAHPSADSRWLTVLHQAFGHPIYRISVSDGSPEESSLPLAFVSSPFFGRFLVSLPYLNSGGLRSTSPAATSRLVDEAVALAKELDCRYLELRHETPIDHPQLTDARTDKCLLRLQLPATSAVLWDQLKAKVRNQVRKGQQAGFQVQWGQLELLDAFYTVFASTMRDLGTPVFSRHLFAAILAEFAADAELCVLRDGNRPVAAALLVHGTQVTEVPSAATLHAYHPSNANMLMYWHLLCRAIERGSQIFDFGRSTRDSGTFRFKRQWGAEPHPAVWQYHVRRGTVAALRPDHAGNRRLVEVWKRLPVWFTRLIGPTIVRGIP